MKKIAVLLLVLCCVIAFGSNSFAEAKMTVTQKTLVTFEGDWKAYFFAKVENTGDTAAYLDYGGKLVGFDADDNVILTEEYVCSYPSSLRLEPGEYAYLREYCLEDELETHDVADYKFSIKAEERGSDYYKLPSEPELDYKGAGSYDNYVNVTFTNTAESVLYGFSITVAMFDQNGDLMFVNGDTVSSVGIHPGSTVTFKVYIDNDLAEYYTRKGLIPTTAESIVYIAK